MEERIASTGEGEIDRQTSENNHYSGQHESSMTSEEEITCDKLIQDEIGHKKGDSSCSKQERESMVLENGMRNSINSDAGQENKDSNETKIEEQKRTIQEQPEAECANSNYEKSENCEKLPSYNEIDKSSHFESRLIEESIHEPSTAGSDEDTSSRSPRDRCPNGEEKSGAVPEGGSHRSPDKQTKVEYRKIKSEVTGEGETSESEGENESQSDKKESERKQETTDKESVDSQGTWIDMLGNGLLRKRVLREGKGQDTRPDKGQVVTIQAAGRTDTGVAVDWHNSLDFILGDGEVIQAFDLAVALMELDEVCELVTDGRYAYGKVGKPQGTPPIPSDATLTYEIQLLAVRDGPNITNMSDDERLKIGEKKRELGNDLYSMEDYSGAINSYQRAIKYLGSSSSQEVQTLRLKCWNNMAAAQLRIKAYSAAEKSCSQVLQVDPENVKALFRKGKVLAQQGETNQALVYTKKADQLDPSNRTIRAELNRLKQMQALEQQSERSLYRRMVGDLTSKNTKKNSRTFLGWPLVLGATVVALGGILVTIYLSRH